MYKHLLPTGIFPLHTCRLPYKRWLRREVWQRLFLLSLALTGPGIESAYAQTSTTPAPLPSETTAPATLPEEPAPLSRSARNNQLLALATVDEVQWLDTPQGEILALFRPTETRMTKGVVLLLHAAELPPGWPAPLESLRRNLPQHGWATLALSLPPRYAAATPVRDATNPTTQSPPVDPPEAPSPSETAVEPEEQNTSAPSPITALIPRAELIAQGVEAALEFLRKIDQPSATLVVDNSSVYDSLQYLQALVDGGKRPVQGLVLINLQPQETLTKAQLASIFSSPSLPVMDVFLYPDSDQQILARKLHRAEALRNKLDIYQQFVLPQVQSPSIDNARSFWLERVRGFIEQQVLANGPAK